ncbi:hypothetical protein ABZV77_00910 [Streptomyces sp. NPDC004732]|uniref:hypothetical protein n=1 Tax=Streptomyces sp. NPDC004732 TaxID=3154290 RepID=UPI0033A25795
MVHLVAEATETQLWARVAGIVMSALGWFLLIVALLVPKAVREEREDGNLEAASKVRRNGLIVAGLGCLLSGGGAALYFAN